jgi:hypothetical protein
VGTALDAQVVTRRLQSVDGIKFPIAAQYTTVAALGGEVAGLLLGPINVGGMIYNAYHATARPHDR